ncbi:MAG: hypothetical protein V4615_14030 [Bacteroidota bacterium]
MIVKILLTVFYLLLFNFLIYRYKLFQFKNFSPFITHVVFNLKFAVGIFIWLIYTFYYKELQNNDIHKFYSDALILRDIAKENPKAFLQLLTIDDGSVPEYTLRMKNWERNFDEAPINENRTVIRLNALLMFLSFKTYFVHILFFCFISLVGWILLTNVVFGFIDTRNSILALPVLLLPSVLFWTSGVMKEPLLAFGLGLLFHGIANSEMRIPKLTAIVTGGFIVLLTKFFVLVCLFPALVAFLFFRKTEKIGLIVLKYILVNTILLLMAFNIHQVVPRVNLQQMLLNKQMNSIKEANYFQAGSRIELPELKEDAISILKTSVIGIWNTITRPYIWEGENVMMLASAIENVFIISLLLMCISFTNWKNLNNLNLFLFLLNFSFLYFALIGMCTPVLGNLVRYKTPLLPLFLFAFMIQVSPKMVIGNLSFLLRK